MNSINKQLGSAAISNYDNVMPLKIKDDWLILELRIAVEIAAGMDCLPSVNKEKLASRNWQGKVDTVKTFLVSVGNNGLTTLWQTHLDPSADSELITNVLWHSSVGNFNISFTIKEVAILFWK